MYVFSERFKAIYTHSAAVMVDFKNLKIPYRSHHYRFYCSVPMHFSCVFVKLIVRCVLKENYGSHTTTTILKDL